MKKLYTFRWPLTAMLSLAASIFFLTLTIKQGVSDSVLKNGDWYTNKSTGSSQAGAIDRAFIAITGLLASTREDSMYYQLQSLGGQPLSLNCSYRIEGHDYDADWWSITAYGWDYFLIPNQDKRYSFNNENLSRSENGRWIIRVGSKQTEGNWLPIGPSGSPAESQYTDHDFDLLLRLYTPGDAYLQQSESAPLPVVTLESCL